MRKNAAEIEYHEIRIDFIGMKYQVSKLKIRAKYTFVKFFFYFLLMIKLND